MEPMLENIDDFNGNESQEKRKTIREVIILCLGIGLVLVVAANIFNTVPDYVGKVPAQQANFNIPPLQ